MTRTRTRARTAAAVIALAVLATGCTGPDESAMDAMDQHSTTLSTAPAETSTARHSAATAHEPALTREERAFLDELTRVGLPARTAADTTVEVGVGICRSIAEGTDTDTILDRIRPLTSALAAQSDERDTDEVGRALIDASRAHLCV